MTLEPSTQSGRAGNLFLDSLPPHIGERFAPHLVPVTIRRGQVLAQRDKPMEYVYFPLHSVISTITQMNDGSAVEVALAGREGIGGLASAFGSRTSLHTSLVQIGNSALRLEADVFEDAVNADRSLRDRVLAYAYYIFTAAAQFAACNRLHPVEERYARWLLMAQERVREPEITLTQEFTAQMLGVRRSGVTIVAGKLSEAGLISYQRGRVKVLRPDALADAACECYAFVNDALRKLLGFDLRDAQPASPGVR